MSDILRYSMYHRSYGMPDKACALYSALPVSAKVNAVHDLECYERACPYGLPVADMLRDAHVQLSC